MATKTHKGQHFVPESYLKAWCDPACPPHYDPYGWIFDRKSNNPRRRAPSNIFKETDLYTIEKADGTRDLRLEHGLSGLESRFARIRSDRLDQLLPLDDEERTYLALFVAAAQFRTRSSRDHHAGQWQGVLNVMDEIDERMKSATPQQKRAAATPSSSSSREKSLSHDQVRKLAKTPLQLMMPGILRSVTSVLLKMNMLILCTDDATGFITSDCPVTWYDPEAYKLPPLYRAPALRSPTIEVTMPLSPRQCLLFAWGCGNAYALATGFIVDELNRRHRTLCGHHYVVRTNARNGYWFKEFDLPDDAWEKRHP
jgi:hypothetical protein